MNPSEPRTIEDLEEAIIDAEDRATAAEEELAELRKHLRVAESAVEYAAAAVPEGVHMNCRNGATLPDLLRTWARLGQEEHEQSERLRAQVEALRRKNADLRAERDKALLSARALATLANAVLGPCACGDADCARCEGRRQIGALPSGDAR